MTLDWKTLAEIGGMIAAAVVGAWATRWFDRKPALISYFGHVGAFQTTPPNGQPIQVHTHAVVVRNAGRLGTTNVRLHHAILPDFTIWPGVEHHVQTLPDGSRDIVIPVLVPGEQITVSYLYFPPVTVDRVNAGIKSDHGFAQQIPVLLQRQYPPWVTRLSAALGLIGIVAVLYLAVIAVRAVFR